MLEFDNYGSSGVRTCGSVSWQIKNEDGSKYVVRSDSKGKEEGLRVGITWYVPWQCDKTDNQLTVKTFNNKVKIIRLKIFPFDKNDSLSLDRPDFRELA